MGRQGEQQLGYAIVRVDTAAADIPLSEASDLVFGGYSVTVKEIVAGFDDARREVDRLNRLNADKGCRYFLQHTRVFSDGGSFGGSPL